MSKLMLAAIKLYHIKDKAHMDNFMNAMVNCTHMEPAPKITSSHIWYWGMKRWGAVFSHTEYEVREGKEVPCSNRKCSNGVNVPYDFEFQGCCSGRECGCMGMEINPVFCEECQEKYHV